MTVDTFSISATANDGYAGRFGATYPNPATVLLETTQTTVDVQRSFASPNYTVVVGLLRFDTSAIPDANSVTAATLRLQVTTKTSANALGFCGEWYAWTTAASSDYTNTPGTSAFAAVDIASGIAVGQNDFALTNLGNVNKTGFTGLRLHVTQRASDAAPTGNNACFFADWTHATQTEAQLIVAHAPAGDLVGMVGV